MKKTLAVLLGLRTTLETNFKNSVQDMCKKFKNDQGIFQGHRNTFKAKEGWLHDSTKEGYRLVQSTVREELTEKEWFNDPVKDFLDTVMSIEKTNASGKAKASLIVDGVNWGEYSSNELLRLRTTLDNTNFKAVYETLPVRNNTEIWTECQDEDYKGRKGVYQNPLSVDVTKTTQKEPFILEDPHADKHRTPMLGERQTTHVTGDITTQKFSGAISLRERAVILAKYTKLYEAVTEALEMANKVESETSDLGTKLIDYLHSDL